MKAIFQLEKRYEGEGKVVPLSEAIARSIKPGMKLHVNSGSNDANAALREIIKQYDGKNPEFTFISSGVTTPFSISLVCSGLARKLIATNCSYTYPTPRPIPLLRKMHEEGRIEIKSWSLYSLEQRLMAGAMGVGFMPTKSLVGTSLGEENADAFQIMEDPFQEGKNIGIVKALVPDISIIHACVADCEGNAIFAPPYFASLWGPRASKGGVILTVEKIVSSEFIRQHSLLVKLPGHLVKYVCPVPFGAHPQGLAAERTGVVDGYGEDYEFILDFAKQSRDMPGLREWMDEWVMKCSSQKHYLGKLGSERILFLKGKSSADAWEYEESVPENDHITRPEFNSTEMMVVTAARELKEIIIKRCHEVVLAGMGTPGLAAWLAYYFLREEDHHIDLLTGAGLIGYSPRPGDPFLITLSNVMTCKMLTDTVEVYGTIVGRDDNRCLSVLGTAQIDKYGNINTVKMGDSYFIGVGGASDAINASETLVAAKQSRQRFVEKVPFISCPGYRVKTLVTDLGVFSKLNDQETFTLVKYFGNGTTRGKEDALLEIKERCGWELSVSREPEVVLPPTSEELALLRALDPKRLFIGK
ncbi:MAG: CoA-transferase [Thermodesulfobacteriota bacterium]|nr:CoA-transferase [Thermodesulfobacteriota bacterium]